MRRDQLVATLGAIVIAGVAGFFAGRGDQRPVAPVVQAPVSSPAPRTVVVVEEQGPQRMAFRRVLPKPEGTSPEICLQFTKALATSGPSKPSDFLSFTPAVTPATRVEGDQICIAGLSPSATYAVQIGAGLPAADGERTVVAETVPVSMQRLSPVVEFAETGYILSREDAIGVPIRTRNLEKVQLRLIRIADRSLRSTVVATRGLGERRISSWSRRTLERDQGIAVWDGSIAVENRTNEMVTTSVPIGEMLADRRPALYALLADAKSSTPAASDEDEDYQDSQIQWVLVTDMALTSVRGSDAMHVFVRALSTGKPLAGVAVDLIARNNDRLERATTDADGHVAFPAALLRGQGAAQALALYAYGPGEDFTLHPLDRPAFDLSDRGVEGRPPPGRFDAFVYSDRGIYRPGETIQANLLLRGGATLDAVADAGVTLRLKRPNGVEFRRMVLPAQALGGFHVSFELPPDASRGQWTVEALVDPAAPPVASLGLEVQDFVPQRLKVEATAPASPLRAGDAIAVAIDAAFLYGAPAAGAAAEARLRLTPDEAPFAHLRGWRFGRHDDKFVDAEVELTVAPTDDAGHTSATGSVPTDIASSRPIKGTVTAEVFEPGGRPVSTQVPVSVRLRDLLLAIRPGFEGDRAPVDTPISLDVAAFDGAGTGVAQAQATYKLVAERSEYFWYRAEGSWRYRRATRDVPVTSGSASLPAGDEPWRLRQTLSWGTYRLEVDAGGAQASYRFHVGWRGEAGAETPDRAEVSADRPVYAAGEIAKINIRPPFAGEVSVVVASDRIHAWRSLTVPAEGATIDVPVGTDWGVGAYVLVTAYRPLATGSARDSKRAVGLVHLGVETADRRMPVRIEAAEVVRPNGPLTAKISVDGHKAGDKAIVTVAAVDEGILQLTRFETPKPERQLLGKRRLGAELRDDYGALLDGLAAVAGALRQGGDSLGGVGLPVVPTRTVALFSGPVDIGADGTASITFDVPDFAGQLRLMAVAYGARRFGHGEAKVFVREPMVAEAYLPRFLAPDDRAEIALSFHNVEAPAGTYRIALKVDGAIALEGAAELDLTLDRGQRLQTAVKMTARSEVGIGTLAMRVTAPDGVTRERSWQIAVRTPFRPLTLTLAGQQMPGEAFKVDPRWLEAFVPGSGRIAVNYGAVPGLDVAEMVQTLDRYPFGCTEQITSRALPLLMSLDLDDGGSRRSNNETTRARLQRAVDRLVDRQDSDGEIGLWRVGDGSAAVWTVVNAIDLLSLAAARGYVVPPAALTSGRAYLRRRLAETRYARSVQASSLYAAYVLARSRDVDAATLRQPYDRVMARDAGLGLGSLAMYGAALFHAGDTALANTVFAEVEARASRPLTLVSVAQDMYMGGQAIDVGIAAAMLAETRSTAAAMTLMPLLRRVAPAPVRATTQELAWMVRAVATVQATTDIAIEEEGGASAPRRPGPVTFRPSAERLAASDYTLISRADRPLFRNLVVHGEPKSAPPALNGGIALTKSFRSPSGETLDPADGRRHDRIVVVIEAEVARAQRGTRDFVLVDMLPAGWEIEGIVPAPPENEDSNTKSRPSSYPWLGAVTRTELAEGRDDRVVAVIRVSDDNRTAGRRMRFAYVVRATTPGSFILPGATMEDMYRPQVLGVTAAAATRIADR